MSDITIVNGNPLQITITPPNTLAISIVSPSTLAVTINQGVSGADAYEIAVVNGFVGTRAEWLDLLVGQEIFEYNSLADFPVTGVSEHIYVAIDTGLLYRWNASIYVNIGGGEATTEEIIITASTYQLLRANIEKKHIFSNYCDILTPAYGTGVLKFDQFVLQILNSGSIAASGGSTQNSIFYGRNQISAPDSVSLTSGNFTIEYDGDASASWFIVESSPNNVYKFDSYALTTDQHNAIEYANTPSEDNPFATIADIPLILSTAPASATDTGTLGEIRITSTYIYVCIATNTWVRAALTTW